MRFQLPNPRKGTETDFNRQYSTWTYSGSFQLPNPRKGTETSEALILFNPVMCFQLPNPRKGTETISNPL